MMIDMTPRRWALLMFILMGGCFGAFIFFLFSGVLWPLVVMSAVMAGGTTACLSLSLWALNAQVPVPEQDESTT